MKSVKIFLFGVVCSLLENTSTAPIHENETVKLFKRKRRGSRAYMVPVPVPVGVPVPAPIPYAVPSFNSPVISTNPSVSSVLTSAGPIDQFMFASSNAGAAFNPGFYW
jgi:hypothetical protein